MLLGAGEGGRSGGREGGRGGRKEGRKEEWWEGERKGEEVLFITRGPMPIGQTPLWNLCHPGAS